MKVQTAAKAIQLQEWANQINARIQSWQTIKAWCEEYGLSSKTYYYRLKRVLEELLDAAEANNALTAEQIQAPGERVKPEYLLYHSRKTVDCAPHITVSSAKSSINTSIRFWALTWRGKKIFYSSLT